MSSDRLEALGDKLQAKFKQVGNLIADGAAKPMLESALKVLGASWINPLSGAVIGLGMDHLSIRWTDARRERLRGLLAEIARRTMDEGESFYRTFLNELFCEVELSDIIQEAIDASFEIKDSRSISFVAELTSTYYINNKEPDIFYRGMIRLLRLVGSKELKQILSLFNELQNIAAMDDDIVSIYRDPVTNAEACDVQMPTESINTIDGGDAGSNRSRTYPLKTKIDRRLYQFFRTYGLANQGNVSVDMGETMGFYGKDLKMLCSFFLSTGTPHWFELLPR